MGNTLFDKNEKIRAAIARAAHTNTKRVALMESSYSESKPDTLYVSAVILKLLPTVYGDCKELYGNHENWKNFEVFAVSDTRLEAVIIRR